MAKQEVQPPMQPEQAQGPYPEPAQGGFGRQMARGISKDLIKAGFGFLGSAFSEEFNDPNLAAPFQEMGINIADTLQDRWFKKEYEDFVSISGEPFKKRLGDLNAKVSRQFDMINRGIYVDESGVTQKLDPLSDKASLLKENMYRSTILETSAATQEYMSAAAKYGNNPYVNREIQSVLAQQTSDIQGLLGPSITTEQDVARSQNMVQREQAGYFSRMPQADTDGSSAANKLKAMSIAEIIEEKGVKGAANYLTSTIDGQERLGTYISSLESADEQTLVNDYKERGIDLINQGDVLKRLLVQGNKKRVQNAAYLAIEEALGSDDPRLTEFKNTTVGKQYEVPKVSTLLSLSPQQIDQQADKNKQQALDAVAQARKHGASTDEAIDEAVQLLTQQLNQYYGQGSPTTKRIKVQVINYLNSKEVRQQLEGDEPKAKPRPRAGPRTRQAMTDRYNPNLKGRAQRMKEGLL